MTTTESKQAAKIHAAELGRTHRIEFETFGKHHIDYIFSHLRTVRASIQTGPIKAVEIASVNLYGVPFTTMVESTGVVARSPRVTAKLLVALRDRGDDVRARRACWTF
jgi:hypothetical protein